MRPLCPSIQFQFCKVLHYGRIFSKRYTDFKLGDRCMRGWAVGLLLWGRRRSWTKNDVFDGGRPRASSSVRNWFEMLNYERPRAPISGSCIVQVIFTAAPTVKKRFYCGLSLRSLRIKHSFFQIPIFDYARQGWSRLTYILEYRFDPQTPAYCKSYYALWYWIFTPILILA